MEKNIKIYTISVLTFLFFLSLSGNFGGILGEILYFLSFIMPLILSLAAAKAKGSQSILSSRPKNLKLVIAASPIALFAILTLSYLTAFLIFITAGAENPSPVSSSFLTDLIKLAILPAVLEEALFRYLPLLLIAGYSRKTAVLISSLYFSLVHASLFSIPYAFLAGVFFILIDILADSVWPSVILHFLNNLISLVLDYSMGTTKGYIFISAFAILAAVSLLLTVLMRKKYSAALKTEFKKDDKFSLSPVALAVAAPTLTIAILNLF